MAWIDDQHVGGFFVVVMTLIALLVYGLGSFLW